MAARKDESDGLFSRMVRLVRQAAPGWHDTDAADSVQDSGFSRQMLKEMIERKRRNDFVRRREFDMLRKLRRKEVLSGQEASLRPSFFQSSMPSRPDDRASTLKKIDEIEAQMSQQWWKAPQHTGPAPAADQPAAAPRPSPRVPPPSGITPTQAAMATTVPATMPAGDEPTVVATESGSAFNFSASRSAALQVGEFTADPEMEEAAIRFANGDDAGAEAALRALVAPGSVRALHEDAWMVLFDFYRATGRQALHEAGALEFAERFGRSAPQWRGPAAAQAAPAPAPARLSVAPAWAAPTVLDRAALAGMQAAVDRGAAPCLLGWAGLQAIDREAVEPFTRLLGRWAGEPLVLEFLAADRLARVLAEHTGSGDRHVDPAWWKLRMEALRLMQRSDEFELAALDYCVTYEVSPPSWEAPRSHFTGLDAEGHSLLPAPVPESAWLDAPTTLAGLPQPVPPGAARLVGELDGDMAEPLRRLDEQLADGAEPEVDCEALLRVDFAAAGDLLNWVSARQERGQRVHFTGLHRLLAHFFDVVGISAHARVSLRRD